MKFRLAMTMTLALACVASNAKKKAVQLFPDGTPIPEWFSDTTKVASIAILPHEDPSEEGDEEVEEAADEASDDKPGEPVVTPDEVDE